MQSSSNNFLVCKQVQSACYQRASAIASFSTKCYGQQVWSTEYSACIMIDFPELDATIYLQLCQQMEPLLLDERNNSTTENDPSAKHQQSASTYQLQLTNSHDLEILFFADCKPLADCKLCMRNIKIVWFSPPNVKPPSHPFKDVFDEQE